MVWEPHDSVVCADDNHRLDHVGLGLALRDMSVVRSRRGSVAGHYLDLTMDHQQNAPVAEDEDQKYKDVERCEMPKEVEQSAKLSFEDHYVANAIFHGA